ncbi:glycosyltransferase [Zhouia sp. PK063]|uniref:glycosyltransferase n=1 Tax=Zhouia sp. PK063 TaxID=3373602 RepID=UPI0037917F35
MKSCVMFCPTKTWGGVEKNVLLRAKFLSELGYNIYVVVLQHQFEAKFLSIPNVQTISVEKRGGDINMFVVRNYVQILNKIKPDVVFSALKKDWFLVTLSARIAKVPRIILYLGILRKIKNSVKYSYVFKHNDVKVLVNSNSLKNHLLQTTSFFSKQNLICVYNGFSIPKNEVQLALKKKFNLANDTILIGCAGRFSKQKGFDLLPEILKQLPNNIHIVHAGKGEFEAEIKQIISESDCANRVHYLGYLENIHPFLSAIDIFLLCSRFEGMANVLNEALSHGKPVVSTKVSGSEELLENGRYGLLAEIEDSKAMAAAIMKIVNREVVFESENLKKHIRQKFSLHVMKLATEDLFFN